MKGPSPILRVDLFFQLIQIYPPLRLFLQSGLQLRLTGLELLELHIVAAAALLLRLAGGDLSLQLRQVRVDGLKFPLLLEGEFQFPFPGTLCRGLGLFRLGRGGLFRPALGLQSVQLPVNRWISPSPRTSKMDSASLSRKNRSWDTARMGPGKPRR